MMQMLKKTAKHRNIEKEGRLRALAFDETELPALLEHITERYSDLTKGGSGKPLPKEYNRIWDEIGEAVSTKSTMVHTGERCRKRWNDLVRVARRKTSAIAALSVTPGGSPTIQEPLTDTKIRALSLVGDSNRVTSGIEAHPLTQDDANDSDHSDTDDRSTASTSGVTQPSPAASGGGASVGDGGGSTSSMWDSWNILHHHRVYIHGIPPWVL